MRIRIVNQFGPPDQSPTARLAGDLCAHWRDEGHQVEVVAVRVGGGVYRRRQRGLGRWLDEGMACLELTLRILFVSGCDCLVVFSSPPMVVGGVAWAGRCRGLPVYHWVLDAYPDVARALGTPLPRLVFMALRWIMRRTLQQCRAVVSVSPAMSRHLEAEYGVVSTVIAPWPELPSGSGNSAGLTWRPPGMANGYQYWIYSGNLGMAHAWRGLLEAQEFLNRRKVPLALVIQGGGAGWLAARKEAEARSLDHTLFLDYAPSSELIARLCGAVARVATQRSETSGLLWPSKLALLQCLPGPLLWVGPEEELDALRSAGTLPVTCFRFAEDDPAGLAACLESLAHPATVEMPEDVASATARIKDSIDRHRYEGLNRWSRLVVPT